MSESGQRSVEQEQAALLLEAFNATSVGTVLVDCAAAGLPVIAANPAFLAITGLAAAEVEGHELALLLAERVPGFERGVLARALADGGGFRDELRFNRPDGSFFWAEFTLNPIVAADGAVRHGVAVMIDVSERKAREEELGQYRRIIEASEQAIGVATPDGTLIYVNPAHERLYGYSSAETLGRSWRELMADPDSDEVRELRQTLAAGRPWRGILRVRDRNGRRFPQHSTVGMVTDDKGAPAYVFNIMYDFSEEQARREELRLAKEAAEAASHAKSEFLSRMSHELRTPMNAILGFAQLLEADVDSPLDDTQRESVEHILKAGWHLLELINEVLDLARIDAGRIALELQPVEVAPLLDECLDSIGPAAAQRQIRLEPPDTTPCGATVMADRDRLRQALHNLLSNAVEFNREGGSVSVRCVAPRDGWLRVEVEDTGPGVDEGVLDRLFEPFERLDVGPVAGQGAGIGLSVSRRLVELMGGELGVSSRVGDGSRFWVDLPLAAGTGSDAGG